MQHTRTRHALLGALAALALVPLAACGQGDAPASSSSAARTTGPGTDAKPFAREFKKLERKYDARLGVRAVDTGNGRKVAWRDGERFAYASTFKALAAGAVLRKYSPGGMDEVIKYSEDDLIANSPVTEKHVGTGMSLGALCDAAVRYSDNAAANLLFGRLGGPKGLDATLEKELGDDVIRMERTEPQLSAWDPDSTRDTSTPRAMADDLRAYVLGDVLGKADRAQLTKWLRHNTTGDALIRAGLPGDWAVGDKTGSGSTYGARNDIAVVWPPGRAPVVMAIMTNRHEKDADYDDKLVADAASVVAGELS